MHPTWCAVRFFSKQVHAAVSCSSDIAPQAGGVAVGLIGLAMMTGSVQSFDGVYSEGSRNFPVR